MFACLFFFSVRIGFFVPFDYNVIFFKSKDRAFTFFITLRFFFEKYQFLPFSLPSDFFEK